MGWTRHSCPAPGYADEEIYLFLARDLSKLNSEVKGDLDEDIEVLILDPNELDNLISSGDEILDAKTVTAWFRAKQFLDKLWINLEYFFGIERI